ncbi:hypothetical protein AGMMS50212_14180 [Spirochaetia bacterium]|nr:hypothetical protein AGMMS50212_14180 [Spirochaetia bacterium]
MLQSAQFNLSANISGEFGFFISPSQAGSSGGIAGTPFADMMNDYMASSQAQDKVKEAPPNEVSSGSSSNNYAVGSDNRVEDEPVIVSYEDDTAKLEDGKIPLSKQDDAAKKEKVTSGIVKSGEIKLKSEEQDLDTENELNSEAVFIVRQNQTNKIDTDTANKTKNEITTEDEKSAENNADMPKAVFGKKDGEKTDSAKADNGIEKIKVSNETEEGIFFDGNEPNTGNERLATDNKKSFLELKNPVEKNITNKENAPQKEKDVDSQPQLSIFDIKNPRYDEKTGFKQKIDGQDEKKTTSSKNKRRENAEITETRTSTAISSTVESKETIIKTAANGKETEITVNLRSEPKNFAAGEQNFRDLRPQVSLENFLAWELHQNLNGDIVRQASIMLRNGGEATIRLALKPESLGNIKIRLEMSENKITGNIVVESKEAMKAFGSELDALKQAFRDSGFDGANLELAMSDNGSGKNSSQQENQNNAMFAAARSALTYDDEVESVFNVDGIRRWSGEYYGNGINVLV